MLKAGIVGLPNVGKSTLFNAVTRSHKAPGGELPLLHHRTEPRRRHRAGTAARTARQNRQSVNTLIPTTIEFVDIAGLVKGSSHGEGLGNKFLSHIREVDAIVHVVRCFEDPDIVHVTGSVDPVRDIEIVNTELVLADIEAVKKRREKIAKDVKRGDKHALLEEHLLEKLGAHLNTGKPANTLALPLGPDEKIVQRSFFLLTDKPTIFACNVKEGDLATADQNPFVQKVRDYVKTHLACEAVVVSAQIESDLIDLSPEEAKAFLKELGVAESGVGQLIRATYHVLGLRTFFTFNEKEVRAWTIHAGDTAAEGRRHHPHRLRARVHQGRNRELG